MDLESDVSVLHKNCKRNDLDEGDLMKTWSEVAVLGLCVLVVVK